MPARFLTTIIGLVVGVALGLLAHWGWALVGLLALIGLAITVAQRRFSLISIFILTAMLGLARVEWADYPSLLAWQRLAEQKVEFIGLVVAEPDERENNLRLTIKPERYPFKVLAVLPRQDGLHYGDKLKLSGKLVLPENFTTTTGREFDYVNYLAKDDILFQILNPQVTKLSTDQGWWITKQLLVVKNWWLDSVGRVIPEPQAALGAGLVVGAKHSLGTEWQQIFRRAGIVHMVVLSGYNVTIIADSIVKIFSFLPRVWSLSFGGVGIALFAVLVGSGPSVIRASIMALLVLLARGTGRIYDVRRALFLVAAAMIMWEPRILFFDPGFQLSFLATFGLLYLSEPVEKKLIWLPEWGGLRGATTSTLATQIFVLPWLLYQTGEISIVALPVNLLVLAAVPLTMLLVFVAGAVGLLSTLLALPFALLAYFFLSYDLYVAKFFANLPGATWTIPAFPLWLVGVGYLVYLYLLYVWSKKRAQ
jgi:competence protein ComEC